MSDSNEKSILIAQVVDAMLGEMFPKTLKTRDDWPEEIKEKIRTQHEITQKYHRNFLLELYDKHMSIEQLEEMLRFQTSEIGQSIKESQKTIFRELNEKYKEIEKQNKQSGGPYIASKTYGLDDEDT